jgi:hypothetical protein
MENKKLEIVYMLFEAYKLEPEYMKQFDLIYDFFERFKGGATEQVIGQTFGIIDVTGKVEPDFEMMDKYLELFLEDEASMQNTGVLRTLLICTKPYKDSLTKREEVLTHFNIKKGRSN